MIYLARKARILYAFSSAKFDLVQTTFDSENKIAYLALNFPAKRNTLSRSLIKALDSSLSANSELSQSIKTASTKLLVVKGEGNVFCSGHNLGELAEKTDNEQILRKTANIFKTLRHLPIPTICIANKVIAAAGVQLALSCDMALATPNASFVTPGIKWGLFCSTPGVDLLRNITSRKKAF